MSIVQEKMTPTETLAKVREALQLFIYETTHLSPEDEHGFHKCRITNVTLNAGREALTLINAAKPMDQWRPIETNEFVSGKRFLVVEEIGIPFIAWRYAYHLWVSYGVYKVNPTHWMPLPSPPKPIEAGAVEVE